MLGIAGTTFIKALVALQALEGELYKNKPEEPVPPKVRFQIQQKCVSLP